MVKTGQAVKEMLVELSQTDQNIIPPFQADKLQRTVHEIREHHEEMTKIVKDAEDRARFYPAVGNGLVHIPDFMPQPGERVHAASDHHPMAA